MVPLERDVCHIKCKGIYQETLENPHVKPIEWKKAKLTHIYIY